MASYSRLSTAEINQMARRYQLGTVHEYSILSGGSENTNYLLRAERGDFVLTICEQKSPAEANNLARILTHLKQHAFSTSELMLTAGGEAITLWGDKPVMVKVFLPGKIMEHLPLHLLNYLGQELGRLHRVPAPGYLARELSYGREHFQEVSAYAAGSAFEQWLLEKDSYISPVLTSSLPKALIHSDVFFSNVIVDEAETRAVIMDFEEAANYYRLFDVGMTIVGLCREGNELVAERVGALLKGYCSTIKLTAEEAESLPVFVVYAATAMCFWRHRQFNYITPEPAMFEHYRALQETADFAMEVKEWFKL